MLPLLIALLVTAAHGQFPPAADPDSLNVARVGEVALAGELRADRLPDGADLYVAGGHALMGDFRGMVHVVAISDPGAMRKVAEIPTPGPALDVKIDGDLAAIGVQQRSGDFGLLLVDIADPANPVVLSRLAEDGWNGVHNLFLHRDRAYLAHASSPGMSVVDISDPTAPFVSGFWRHRGDFSNVVHDVFVRPARDGAAPLAVVSDIVSGLVLLDLADPDAPVTLSTLPFAEGVHSAWAAGDYVYCSAEFGGWERRLYVVDIADPRRPEVVHSFGVRPPPADAFIGPHNPFVRDGLLYWAYYDGGFRVFDLLDPARPVEIGYHSYPGFAWSAHPHGDGLVYVADSSVGVEAFRFEEPAFAVRAVSADPPVAVRGNHRSIGVKVAVAPSPRGIDGAVDRVAARFGDQVVPLTAEGGAYTGVLALPPDLPTGRHRLAVELVDDRGRVYPFARPYDLYPERDLAIYAEAVADGWIRTGNVPRETQLVAGRRALTLPERFATTFRATAPFDPTGYAALRFAFHPGAATAAATNALAVTVGERTIRLGLAGGDSLAISLADARWQQVEVPLAALGLAGDARAPTFTAVRISGQLRGTAHIADIALAAAAPPADTAVRETAAAPPAAFALAQNFPNPFNAATVIRFALDAAADIDLAVYNAAGQKVATLASGARAAGPHAVGWDGRDGRGAPLASGVYFYRLRTAGREQARGLTLLR